MNRDFYEYYALFNLQPGASWHELKTAYRLQVRKWHPDRMPEDTSDRHRAEERTKSINRAYDELTRYYHVHGCLPLAQAPLPAIEATIRPDVAAHDSARPDTTPTKNTASEQKNFVSGTHRLLTVIGLGLAAYVLIRAAILSGDPAQSSAPTSSTRHSDPAADATTISPTFGFGSSLGEVYSAQGIPSRTEGDIWYYGTSKIYFANGTVIRWEENPSHPLNTRLHQNSKHQERPQQFSLGATKTEVRLIQGEPVRESQNVWDYGISRVYFEADRVVGWHESPIDPLKVRR